MRGFAAQTTLPAMPEVWFGARSGEATHGNISLMKRSITLIYFITAHFVGTATHSDIRPNITQRDIRLGKIYN